MHFALVLARAQMFQLTPIIAEHATKMATGGDDYQRALVENFVAVTGADAERATFFLQSAAWNLQV